MNPNEFSTAPSAADADIRDAMSSTFISSEPSEALMRRLRSSANDAYEGKAKRVWSRRFVLAGTAVAIVAGLALTLTPSKAMAKSFALVVNAVDQAKSFQLSINSHEHGKAETFTVAETDGRFTMHVGDGTLMKMDSQSLQIYSPADNCVTTFEIGGLVDMRKVMEQARSGIAEGMKEMDLKKMLADYRAEYGDDNIHVSPVTTVNGESVYYVTLQLPSDDQRVQLAVAADTDLPKRVDIEKRESNGTWGDATTIEVKFNQAVDPSLIKADFPANAKHQDFNLGALIKGFGKAFTPPAP